MTKKLALILLVFFPVLLASCAEDVVGPSDLQGTEWRLRSLARADGSTVSITDPSSFTIRFGNDGNLAARVDCNGCGGSYRIEGGSLIAGPFACTLIFCGRGLPETEFVNILDGRSSIEIDGSRLTITSPRGSLVFER
jgi:heat shock protein HslJ